MGLTPQEILDNFYEQEIYTFNKKGFYTLPVNTQKLAGRLAPVDIVSPKDKSLIIEQGKRITARHIRQIDSNKIKNLISKRSPLIGLALSKDYNR